MIYGLNKSDKLCSPAAIDQLFSRGADAIPAMTAMAYPLRAVWVDNATRSKGANIQFLISIPKKRLRHAVDRVKMRRRVREAYRLNHKTYDAQLSSKVNLAFIYVANELKDYSTVEKAVIKILQRIHEQNYRMAD